MLAPVYLIQDGGLTLDALKKYFDTCQNKNRAKRLSVRANRLLFRANRLSVRAKRLQAKRLSGETTAILDRYLSALTMGTITVMAIQKWIQLYHPKLITRRRAYIIYVGLLIIPALFTGVRMWLISVRRFREVWVPVLRAVVGGLCFLALVLSYFKVFKTIRRQQLQIQVNQATQSWQSPVQTAIKLAKYKKSAYTIFFIVALFLLCYVPSIICMSVVVLLNWFNEPFSVVYHVLFTLFYVSSSINPFLYYSRINEIRVEVRLLLRKIVCKG